MKKSGAGLYGKAGSGLTGKGLSGSGLSGKGLSGSGLKKDKYRGRKFIDEEPFDVEDLGHGCILFRKVHMKQKITWHLSIRDNKEGSGFFKKTW